MFTSEMCEREVVAATRNLVKSHLPDSNPWVPFNNLYALTSVFGGLAFSALQEARNGIDTRVMVDTAAGTYLDAIAARPPYNTTRQPATKAKGCVDVCFAGVASLAIGDALTRSDGTAYSVCCDVTLDADGCGQVEVEADVAGPDGNAVFGYPFTDARGEATVCKNGIGGGLDVECDDDLRDRLFSLQPGCQFGSLSWVEQCALGVTGIRYAKACEEFGGKIALYVGTKPGPAPTQVEVDAVQAAFDEPCKRIVGACVDVRGIVECPVDVVLENNCPAGVSAADVLAVLQAWAADVQPGTPITGYQIESVIAQAYPSHPWRVVSGSADGLSNCVTTFASVSFE